MTTNARPTDAITSSAALTAAKDFATSNETFNRFLGAKRKSWMTAQPATIDNTTRSPRVAPSSGDVSRTFARPSTTAHHPSSSSSSPSSKRKRRHSPSVSTSPKLANVVDPPTSTNSLNPAETVLPSPTPSLERVREVANNVVVPHDGVEEHAAETRAPGMAVEEYNRDTEGSRIEEPNRQRIEDRTPLQAQLHSRPPSQLQGEGGILADPWPLRGAGARQSQGDNPQHQEEDRTRTNAQAHQGWPAHTRGCTYADLIAHALLQAPSHRLTAKEICDWIAKELGFVLGQGSWQSGVAAILSSNRAFRKLPKEPKSKARSQYTFEPGMERHFQQRFFAPANSAMPSLHLPPLQEPFLSVGDTSGYSFEYCSRVLESYASRIGHSNFGQCEHSRLQLLRTAVRQKDRFYLSLHQLLCAATVNQNLLHPQIKNMPEFVGAYSIMETLLISNKQLDPDFVSWSASFPFPIHDTARYWPAMYQDELQKISRFIVLLQQRWHRFMEIYTRRGWPPLVREIEQELGVPSLVLQVVIFTAVLRTFGGSEGGAYETKAGALFQKNQREYYQRMSQAQPLTPEEIAAEDRFYRQAYRQLLFHPQQGQHAFTDPAPANFQTPTSLSANFHSVPAQNRVPPNTLNGAGILQQPIGDTATLRQNLQRPTDITVADPRRVSAPQTMWPSNILRSSAPAGRPTSQANLASLPHVVGSSPITQSVGVRPHSTPVTAAPPLGDIHSLPLLAAAGRYRAQHAHPNPMQLALHQAHLRSPVLGSLEFPIDLEPPQKLYRYVKGFKFGPQPLAVGVPMHRWSFNVSANERDAMPRDQKLEPGQPALRVLREGSTTYRLRCVNMSGFAASRLRNGTVVPAESDWVVSDNVWPAFVYVYINSQYLEPRRKLHHGRDLPIDITPYIKEGENVLEVFVNLPSDDKTTSTSYAFAVEVVDVKTHESILKACKAQTITSENSVEAIKASLSGMQQDNDDIAIVSSNLTINLFDPFSACKIFDIPVRGTNCLHRDCFDLETFLQTRKRRQPDWPSEVDDWKCPLCKADVRPQSLVVDGFLVSVRAQLAEQRLLDTRAIVVEQDGSWRPKVENFDAHESKSGRDTMSVDVLSVAQTLPRQAAAPITEVVDLGDEDD